MKNLQEDISKIKVIDTKKLKLIKEKLKILTINDLINFFPIRYEDYTKTYKINQLKTESINVRITGKVSNISIIGSGKSKRLVVTITDDTGTIDLIWFKGINFIQRIVNIGFTYHVIGKTSTYFNKVNIIHPSLNNYKGPKDVSINDKYSSLLPVYSLSNSENKKYLNNDFLINLIKQGFLYFGSFIKENIPHYLIDKYKLVSRSYALYNMHFPNNFYDLKQAKYRLKFEELLYLQLVLLKSSNTINVSLETLKFNNTELLKEFYENHLPFNLTESQKKTIKEVYKDLSSGRQMNRLLQGDVGSGKTIVAFLSMLIPIADGFQATLMAPTSILSEQHYCTIKEMADKLDIPVRLITGSTSAKQKKIIQEELIDGKISILVGTHSLIYDNIKFKNLALSVIDEQHKFGVNQRSKLWEKNIQHPPHILIMTATPIPRTMAMVFYNDLNISTLKELPIGRLPIKTYHLYDSARLKIFNAIRNEINKGRQVYIVYPLIEESDSMNYKYLMDGYESIQRAFPDVSIGILHGKMKVEDKEYEMDRFGKNITKILVCTTVVEVGIDVPNATLIIIESAERFGLSQLHQLRGRVGRSSFQSYCILVTDVKLTSEAKQRIKTMVMTNDGFKIADVDLQIRGPGNIAGLQQSGTIDLKVASFSEDHELVEITRELAKKILKDDPGLDNEQHKVIKYELDNGYNYTTRWSNIS